MPSIIPTNIDFKPVGGNTSITSIAGGSSFDIVITMSGTDTSATSVALSVDNSTPLNGTWPTSVNVPASANSARVTVSSNSVSAATNLTFTATANSGSASASIAISTAGAGGGGD